MDYKENPRTNEHVIGFQKDLYPRVILGLAFIGRNELLKRSVVFIFSPRGNSAICGGEKSRTLRFITGRYSRLKP